jgi:hypothetical protein
MKVCNSCKTKNNDDSIFCKKCGKKLKGETDIAKIVLLVGVILVLFSSIFFGILNWEHMNNVFRLLFFVFETCLFFLMSLALRKVSKIPSRIFFVIGLILAPFTLSMVPYYNVVPSILYKYALIFLYLAIIYLLTFVAYKLINLKFKCKFVDYLALFALLLSIIFTAGIFEASSLIVGLILVIYMIALHVVSKIKFFSENKSYYNFSMILSYILTIYLVFAIGALNDSLLTISKMIISAITLTLFVADGYIKMFKERTVMHFFYPFMLQLLSFVYVCTMFGFNDTGIYLSLIILNMIFYFASLIFKNKLFSITTLVLTYVMFGLLTMISMFDANDMWLVIISSFFLVFNICLLIVKKYNFAHFFIAVNVLTLVLGFNSWLYNFDELVIFGFLSILYLIIYLIMNLVKNKYDFMYLILMLLVGFISVIVQADTSFSLIKLIICLTFAIGYVLVNIFKEHISIRIIWFVVLNLIGLVLFNNIYYSLLTISMFTIIAGIILQKITKFNFKPHLLYAEILVFGITLSNTMEYSLYALFINVLAYILGYVSLVNFHNKKWWKIPFIMVGLLYITKLLGVVIDPTIIYTLISLLVILIVITSMYLLDRFNSKELVIISLVSLIPYYELVDSLYVNLSELTIIPFIVYAIILIFAIKWKKTVTRNVFILVPFFIFAATLMLTNSGVVSTIIDAVFAVTYIILGLVKRFNLLVFFGIGYLILAILLQIFTVLSSMAAIIALLVVGFILIFVAVIYSTKKKD